MRKTVLGWKKTLGALGYRVRWNFNAERQRESSADRKSLQYGNLEPRQLLAAPQVEAWLRNDYFIEQPQQLTRPDLIETISVQFDQDVAVEKNDLSLVDLEDDHTVSMTDVGFDYDPIVHTATWNFANVTNINPAIYTATLQGVTSVVGGQGLADSAVTSRSFYVAIPGDSELVVRQILILG